MENRNTMETKAENPAVVPGEIGRTMQMLMIHPEVIGREVGFRDLLPMHGVWIRDMVFGEGDYTLQAHRGSYKSSCLAVAIAIIMVMFPHRNIIFLRKTDDISIRSWTIRSMRSMTTRRIRRRRSAGTSPSTAGIKRPPRRNRSIGKTLRRLCRRRAGGRA